MKPGVSGCRLLRIAESAKRPFYLKERQTNSVDQHSEGNVNKPGPLAGVKIIEYGVFHAGPGAGAILGDLGAEVTKIEAGFGDPERYWTVVGGMDISVPSGESIMFEVSNRNKKGIHLDIKKEKGREVLLRLVAGADVFLTNLRRDTKKALGIDYPSLKAVNADIIHASVSGYGQRGPAGNIGAFDPLGQARSGMMFLHDPGNPALIHLAVLDQATAITMSHAILTALFVRERHGWGQAVDTSLYSSGMWLVYANLFTASLLSADPGVSWIRSENSPLRNNFQCADGSWIIGVHHPEEKYWETFCRATDQMPLCSDDRFADNSSRQENCCALVEIFDRVMLTKDRDEWMAIFENHGLMFTPIQTVKEVLSDPQALANDYIVEFDHPEHGRIKIPGYPAKFSRCSAGTSAPAPGLGEHTDMVLKAAGYSEEEIRKLREDEVVR